ncbi:MAG TPA: TetR/AcrR family transcriptional regulator [Candidatus Eisenbacteria bacterium]|nr:TetR/AcrR family transcriptional regulator [Candidatus Eisenbacteria bacterium]
MRTAAKDSPTKEKLLRAAQDLVLARGFSGTTVDDICKSARLTKGSFFHYFKGKEDLGRQLLEQYCGTSKASFASGCCSEEKDPLKRIYGFLDFVIAKQKGGRGKGCLLGCMAQELADTDPVIRSMCSKAFEAMGGLLEKDLREAKKKYGADVDPVALARHFVVVLEGSMLVARVGGGARGAGLEHYKAYLRALFGR